jgi:hypothetical protein
MAPRCASERAVQVLEVQPHPLGGFKATRVELAASERGKADALADAQDAALAAGPASFLLGAGPAVSLLTALVMTEAERAEVPASALAARTREAVPRPEVVGRWLTRARVR